MMTAKEKRLRADGMIPPKKKPLNRRRFADEVMQEFFGGEKDYRFYAEYLPDAIALMLPGSIGAVSPEEVGTLKVLRIALDMAKRGESINDVARGGETAIRQYMREVVEPVRSL